MSDPGILGWCAQHMAKASIADAIPMPPAAQQALDRLDAATREQERINALGREHLTTLGTLVERMREIERRCLAAQAMARADREAVELAAQMGRDRRRRECGISDSELLNSTG